MQRPVGRPARRGFRCLSVWPWRLLPSARWGAKSACPPAWRAATQMAATKAAAHTGAAEAVMQAAAPEAAIWAVASVGDRDASSGTGSGDACGGCEAVKDPRCTGAGDPLSTSGYATADESLATGSN